ncbi:MAG: restriction endonuclease subunit S [Treponema sp.]|nr:restriction endonuclease subunit S [Treponema sp.]
MVNIKKSIEPGSDAYSDEGLPFIRVSDYNKLGISPPDKCLSDTYCHENAALLKSLYPTKETILFSKDGSVGTAYILRENMQAVTSGAILHLSIKDKSKVLPEYLTLALNSEVVKMQAERDAGGSIILHWRVSEIEDTVIPIVSYKLQHRIAELAAQSFTLHEETKRLLEDAKEMVEREIEKV